MIGNKIGHRLDPYFYYLLKNISGKQEAEGDPNIDL